MKQIYLAAFTTMLLFPFSFCSKDISQSYERRIVGTWKVTDIDRVGTGSYISVRIPEQSLFTFEDDGKLVYNVDNQTYQGTWRIRTELAADDDERISLNIIAVDFTNQDLVSENFNEIFFTSSNKFKAFIYTPTRTYIYHFSRQ
jgi:hypothetical protein